MDSRERAEKWFAEGDYDVVVEADVRALAAEFAALKEEARREEREELEAEVTRLREAIAHGSCSLGCDHYITEKHDPHCWKLGVLENTDGQ